jgi:hypothetical protein
MTRRATFQFMVPVHVEVEDGQVVSVHVIDETPVADPTYVDGDETYVSEAARLSQDGQAWPSWSFGY